MALYVAYRLHYHRAEIAITIGTTGVVSFLLSPQRPNQHTCQRYLQERAIFDDALDKELKRKYVDISCAEATCWAYGALRAKDRPNEEYGPPRKFVGVLRNVWREY